MRGQILYPLSQMKDKWPDLFEAHMRRYAGRPELSELRIPMLNCSWHDVIFFSAVHPQVMRNALREAKIVWPVMKSYRIPAGALRADRTAVLLGASKPGLEFEYEVYSPEDMGLYQEIPSRVLEYYRVCSARGETPFLFHGITQILYRGTLNIAGLQIEEGR